MLPWCNRIQAGPTAVAGSIVNVEANFRDGTAIHGQAYGRPWEDVGNEAMPEFRWSGGGDGWPWPYSAAVRFRVAGSSVVVEQSLSNRAETPMPAGVGLHPWFRRPVEVAIAADLVFHRNSASPQHPQPVDGVFDRRAVGALALGVDATWSQLGNPPVRFAWSHLGVAATMAMNARRTYVVAASPADLDAIAVEPQTHAPDGLRRLLNGEPGAMTLIDPGESLTLETTLLFKRMQEEES